MGIFKKLKDFLIDPFDCISPIDYRYRSKDLIPYLSENAFTRYKAEVECALVEALAELGIIPEELRERAIREVKKACAKVTTQEVYREEAEIGHDIRALVNCIRKRVSKEVRPWIHFTATSYDIIETANAARYRDAVLKVLLPKLQQLMHILIGITLAEKDTPQIGRTHLQHAVPITFGFAMAWYVSRLGKSVLEIERHAKNLRGKFSGAVGASNAAHIFMNNVLAFEPIVLEKMGLEPNEISTQIAQPEAISRLLCEITIMLSVLGNLADDLRNLQRPEINETVETHGKKRTDSSTMVNKNNPNVLEQVKSVWRTIDGRIQTALNDLFSDYQRDLTNSLSSRTYGETIAYAYHAVSQMTKVLEKLTINHKDMAKNIKLQGDWISGEPLQLALSRHGFPNGHEAIRVLSKRAKEEGKSLVELAQADPELAPYFLKMTFTEKAAIENPSAYYLGLSSYKAETVAKHWLKELGLD